MILTRKKQKVRKKIRTYKILICKDGTNVSHLLSIDDLDLPLPAELKGHSLLLHRGVRVVQGHVSHQVT